MAGIKTLELDPTRENVYKTLVADSVGRNKNLWQFACFCSVQKSRCSIALDSGWGMGKTFFLKQLEMLFNHSDLEENEQNGIEKSFVAFKGDNKIASILKPHACVYYDAWLNDDAEDPMRSLLYCMIKHKSDCFLKQSSLDEESKRKINLFVYNTKECAKKIYQFNDKKDLLLAPIASLESFLGGGSLTDSAKSFNPTREVEAQKSFYDAFSNFLNSLIPNKAERLLVLIDELDRCKPAYAVQLLERIKHYFSNERITFVFAINEEQLLHTIRVFYGDGFDAYRYLDRFFDYRLSLPPPDMRLFNKFCGFDQVDENSVLYVSVCDAFVQEYSLSPREATKYRQWVKIVCHSFLDQQNIIKDKSWQIVICIITPVLLGLKIYNKDVFTTFVNGGDFTVNPLRRIVGRCHTANYFLSHLNHPKIVTFNGKRQILDSQDAANCIETIYKCLFVQPSLWIDSASKCGFTYVREMRDTIFGASTLMADFIKYDTNTEETAHG